MRRFVGSRKHLVILGLLASASPPWPRNRRREHATGRHGSTRKSPSPIDEASGTFASEIDSLQGAWLQMARQLVVSAAFERCRSCEGDDWPKFARKDLRHGPCSREGRPRLRWCGSSTATWFREDLLLSMESEPTANAALLAWLRLVALHTQPSRVDWCLGLSAEHVERGAAARDPELDSEPPELVSVATGNPVDAGPTNRWMSPAEARGPVWELFRGAMSGRTMFVVPYVMGPPSVRFSGVGIQVTDSVRLAHRLLSTVPAGRRALELLGNDKNFVCGLHSVAGQATERRHIVHFPETAEFWAIGSASPTNALLSEPRHALRVASACAREGGWLAENMSIVEVFRPDGESCFMAVARTDHDAKAGLSEQGVGCHLTVRSGPSCWLRPGDDGQLWALDPTWSGASWAATSAIGRTRRVDAGRGRAKRRDERLQPVPISAIVLYGHQPRSTPLVYECRNWRHGVYVGSTLVTRGTSTDASLYDPIAMRSYCAYNMGDYLSHWLSLGRRLARPPRFFHVNRSRARDGKPLWPAGEDGRIFEWIYDRLDGGSSAYATPIGFVPTEYSINASGLDVPADALSLLLSSNPSALLREAERSLEFLGRFRQRLPPSLLTEHRGLVRRLQSSFH